MKTWFTIVNKANEATEILIYDQIGAWGITAKDFKTALDEIPKSQEILLSINSGGGDVFDAFAIYNNIAARRKKVVARIDGIAASAASFIALAGRELVMPENAMMMIHNAEGVVIGNAKNMRDMAETLDKISNSIIGIYEKKTGKERPEIEKAMDAEQWFTAEEAKDFGFADEITDAIEVTASVDLSKFRNTPKQLLEKESMKTNEPAPTREAVLEKLVALKMLTAADVSEKDALEQIDAAFAVQITATTTLKDELAKTKETNTALRKKLADRAVSDAVKAGQIKNDDLSISLWTNLFLNDADDAQKMLGSIAAATADPKAAARSKPSNAGDPLNLKAADDSATSSDDILDQYNAMPEGKEKENFFGANTRTLLNLQRARQAAEKR